MPDDESTLSLQHASRSGKAHQARGGFSGSREGTACIRTKGSTRSASGEDCTSTVGWKAVIAKTLQQVEQTPHLCEASGN